MQKLRAGQTAFFKDLYPGEHKVLVFGEGDRRAKLMLIGEAPGEQEALSGRPFVGKAGKNLDQFLALTGVTRDRLYITNVVKFRPVRPSAAGNLINRPPTAEEIKLSLPWLEKEIALIAPRLIVTLGNVPLRALTGRQSTIGKMHGALTQAAGRPLYPLYHPASVIYNPSLREIYLEDVRRLKELLEEMGI
ncbi:MAG: uracil-DNA glycosylase [Clostridiales bacterium]|nr:uracil-DNA glycosylase [Clostridiales bacterium]